MRALQNWFGEAVVAKENVFCFKIVVDIGYLDYFVLSIYYIVHDLDGDLHFEMHRLLLLSEANE